MTTAVSLSAPPILQFFDNDGRPCVGGSVLTQVSGVNTATYQDSAGTIPLPNPIPLNNRGEISNSSGASCQLFLITGYVYTLTLSDAAGNQLNQATYVGSEDNGVATFRAQLADPTNAANGPNLIGFGGTVAYTTGLGLLLSQAFGRTADEIAAGVTPTNYGYPPGDVRRYGAVGDGVTDDTAAIQAAIVAVPKNGRLYFPRGKYKIVDELRITQPMLICGDGPGHILEGYDTADNGSYVVQTNTAKMAFKLVAALTNYAFGQYGVCGVHFQDLCIQGANLASKIVACIGVDTTINAGDFHIRGNSTTRCNLRYAVDCLNFTGIAYINNFYQTNFLFGTRGVKIARGTASDSGGQTRFFGCLFEFCTTAASLNEDTVNGVFSFFGCTIGDGTTGISTNDEVSLEIHGSNFEANSNCGIYVLTPAAKANSNSSHFRNILGSEFYNNGVSIWFDKQATSASDGNFNYPTRIDANSFSDALAIKLTVPGGHPGFASTNFVIGASNCGLNNGALQASQVSAFFFGTDERRRRYSKRFAFTGSYVSGSAIDMLPVGLVPTSVRMYLTANASGFTAFNLGDIGNSSRYLTIANAQTQVLNTWVSWTPTVPQLLIDATNNQFRLIGTGGILGAAGVIEVEGYVT